MCSGQAAHKASGGRNKQADIFTGPKLPKVVSPVASHQQQMPHPRDLAPAQKVPWEQKGTE